MNFFSSAGVFKISKCIDQFNSYPTNIQILWISGASPIHVCLAGEGHQHGQFGAAWVTRGNVKAAQIIEVLEFKTPYPTKCS